MSVLIEFVNDAKIAVPNYFLVIKTKGELKAIWRYLLTNRS